ncbi:hypothetical protein D3C71_1670830 [compost metagenome]
MAGQKPAPDDNSAKARPPPVPAIINTGLRPIRSLSMPSGSCSTSPPIPANGSSAAIWSSLKPARRPYTGKLLFRLASIYP